MQTFDEVNKQANMSTNQAPTGLFGNSGNTVYNSSPFSSTQPDKSPFSFGSMATPTNSVFGNDNSLAANAPQGISTGSGLFGSSGNSTSSQSAFGSLGSSNDSDSSYNFGGAARR